MIRQRRDRQSWPTLAHYGRRRNGVPLGAAGSLIDVLRRSRRAGTVTGFWRLWNPIWGHYPGRSVNSSLQRVLPPAPALVVAFAVSGSKHESALTLVTGSLSFLFDPGSPCPVVLLSPWFGIDYRERAWVICVAIITLFVLSGLGVTSRATADVRISVIDGHHSRSVAMPRRGGLSHV